MYNLFQKIEEELISVESEGLTYGKAGLWVMLGSIVPRVNTKVVRKIQGEKNFSLTYSKPEKRQCLGGNSAPQYLISCVSPTLCTYPWSVR
jgi:hypothetical protein